MFHAIITLSNPYTIISMVEGGRGGRGRGGGGRGGGGRGGRREGWRREG